MQTVDLTSKLLQVLALLVGGTWAAWTWFQLNGPSLNAGLDAGWKPGRDLAKSCKNSARTSHNRIGNRAEASIFW